MLSLLKSQLIILKTSTGELASSKKVLIIGGGPTGIELAGEIATTQKDKNITIITSGKGLLSNRTDLNEKLAINLQGQLEKLGVECIFDERVDFSCFGEQAWKDRYLLGPIQVKTEKGREIDADLVFFCQGSYINYSAYAETLEKSMNKNGELRVNEFNQVEGHEKIFAIGDCCDADHKMAFCAAEQGTLVANNIIAHIEKRQMKKRSKSLQVMSVPLGTNGGAGQLPIFGVVGPLPTSILKGGDLFVKSTWTNLNFKGVEDKEGQGTEGEDKDGEKRKNLMSALGCGEEEAQEVQNKLLPVKEVKEGENHI